MDLNQLQHCTLCPRGCGVDRFSGRLGYCRGGADFEVSSVCIHQGEEPVISGRRGICNIFFPHCNLQCIFCQNHQISRNTVESAKYRHAFEDLIRRICMVLDQTENIVGFVSPSHYIPQMAAIIQRLREIGRNPIFVYNTNCYDKVATLRQLEGLIDIYLPDFKYLDSSLAAAYSNAPDYVETAKAALGEMYRQKGSTLRMRDDGIAEAGLIIRHLVLPGNARQSVEVLDYLADALSVNLHISLMAQYDPTPAVQNHPVLNRPITPVEYETVTQALEELGFYRGWVQDLESHATFRPDFSSEQPFQTK